MSMNIDNCLTTTTVEFNSKYKYDEVVMNGEKLEDLKKSKVIKIVNLVRDMAKLKLAAKIVSKNSFPSDAGIAASASAFSALALASSKAAGINLNKCELSILARLGSGSGARSVVDGFAYWKAGKNSNNSCAVKLEDENYWDLRDIVAVVDAGSKKVSSTEGHLEALTSPFFQVRLRNLKTRIQQIKYAFLKKDFKRFGELVEEEATELHIIAMSSNPPIFYWRNGTLAVIDELFELRKEGLLAYFTIDAGPNVHVICEGKNERKVNLELKKIHEVLFTIVNKPCKGTLLIDKHLF